ncbi:hypothetical protein [Microbacterium sp. NPDC096154]|uniref:hypothetical protein n=1 Tax=Microbacterium sp. NPDC096154 TaxID=3155549 RepID=UPI003328E043
MLSRSCSVVAAALLLAALTGCTGSGKANPSPSPTGFASEEEAFAAAEELYRDYTAALNSYYAGADAYEPRLYLTADALTEGQAFLALMKEQDLQVDGEVEIRALQHGEAAAVESAWSVTLFVCLDYSGTRVLDAHGTDVTPERDESLALKVSLMTIERFRLAIEKSVATPEFPCG